MNYYFSLPESPGRLSGTHTCEACCLRRQEGAPRQEEEQAGLQQRELMQFGKFGQVTKTS